MGWYSQKDMENWPREIHKVQSPKTERELQETKRRPAGMRDSVPYHSNHQSEVKTPFLLNKS